MATAGAVGDTQDEMVKTLCLDNYNKEFHEQYKQLLEYLQTPIEKTDFQGGDNYRLNIVNSIFSNINFPIKQEYIDLVSEFYNVKFSELDFSDCSLVAKKINKFIDENTNHHIQNMVNSYCFDKNTLLALINCVWFKGSWEQSHKFESKNTNICNFYGMENQKIWMMNNKAGAGYYEDENIQALQLNYQSDPYNGGPTMTFVLPKNSIDGLNLDLNYANKIIREMKEYKVDYFIPKFKFEQDFSLISSLKELGIKKAFEDDADFSNICERNTSIVSVITKILHRACIEIDESGTEAAAATCYGFSDYSGENSSKMVYKTFLADHPFIYWISDKQYRKGFGNILFMGKLSNWIKK